jgi:hypothetical protein
MARGDDDAGDELGRPGSWPSVGYDWPAPPHGLVHGVQAVDEFAEVGAAAKKDAGPLPVTIKHTPKHGKNPPWLTWGNTQVQTVTGIPLAASIGPYVQLVNLRYGRPETWRFFLAAKLLATGDSLPPVVGVTVEYQVTIGNGFTSFTADFFQVLEFAAGAQLGDVRMCTSTEQEAAKLSDTAPNVLELIPAQDIYVAARIVTEGSINAGNTLTMAMTAMVAPNVHVRPGWFLDIFPGAEENY